MLYSKEERAIDRLDAFSATCSYARSEQENETVALRFPCCSWFKFLT
ncbi:MAG: hypothetical protein FWC36_06510 [Spirochaetes bacterium]|nr:hypothetical protein [Spirochaetota bacterium]